jgi:hypothetical protein
MVCLLSLGIAVQGHASVRVMDTACPMQHAVAAPEHEEQGSMDHAQMHHASMEHADVDAADLHPGAQINHSHTGHDTAGRGKHCQHDVGCQSAAPAIAATMIAVLVGTPAMQAPPAAALSFRSHIPPLLARPPALA